MILLDFFSHRGKQRASKWGWTQEKINFQGHHFAPMGDVMFNLGLNGTYPKVETKTPLFQRILKNNFWSISFSAVIL